MPTAERVTRQRPGRAAAGAGVLLVLILSVTGCQQPETRFRIATYAPNGTVEPLFQDFDECYFSTDARGNIDLVAVRRTVSESGDARLTQVVHVRTIYRAVPGSTHVDRTMINALVNYAILSDGGGACYEGGGFLYTEEYQQQDQLVGQLQEARLHPYRRTGEAPDLFDRAELTGRFKAVRNRKAVTGLLNELNRLFGPQPSYEPPPVRPDLM